MSAQLLPPNVEASKMLEAALQQMDGIIAGKEIASLRKLQETFVTHIEI